MNVASQQTQAGPSEIPCAGCGRLFPTSDVIEVNHLWVCGGCKPLFLQQLREGVIPVDTMADIWRVKHQLVTRKETPFPDRCVRCNAPVNGYRHKIRFITIGVFGWRTGVLHVGVCEKHVARNILSTAILFAGMIGAFAVIVVDSSPHAYIEGIYAFAIFFAGIVMASIVGLRVSAAKIAKDKIWLTGVNKDFLARLPEWRE